jgi:hypothetical protein
LPKEIADDLLHPTPMRALYPTLRGYLDRHRHPTESSPATQVQGMPKAA